MRELLTALLLLMLSSAPAAAQEARQVRRGQPVAADGSVAYLLFRVDPREGPGDFDYVLARELPGAAPTGRVAAPPRFDPAARLIRTDSRYPFVDQDGHQAYLLTVPPGNYAIVAVTYKRMPSIGTCMCMGTVRFEARAGVVNDLGFLLGAIEDRPTQIPELAPFTGSPSWTHTTPALAIMSVRPAADGMEVPAALRALPLVRAEYGAVGKFPNHFRTMINRIPPVPGVLDYDGDRAVDLRVALE
ncbi:MAG TPA: hypothetical protein VGB54_05345 [Allosphingosinicella sp.]|jgi:hypothetical protein